MCLLITPGLFRCLASTKTNIRSKIWFIRQHFLQLYQTTGYAPALHHLPHRRHHHCFELWSRTELRYQRAVLQVINCPYLICATTVRHLLGGSNARNVNSTYVLSKDGGKTGV